MANIIIYGIQVVAGLLLILHLITDIIKEFAIDSLPYLSKGMDYYGLNKNYTIIGNE